MSADLRSLRPWLNFAGCVLVVAVLYWTQAVLIPVALAVLLSFVLTPLVVRIQKWIGRVAAVLLTVALAFTVLGLTAWGLVSQLTLLVDDLPKYRLNIRDKVEDIRAAGHGSTVETVQETIEDIKSQMDEEVPPTGTPQAPVVVQPAKVANPWSVPTLLGPVLAPLTTAGLVIVLVIFLLIERDAVRGRLIRLIGRGHLAVTTKAFEEAGRRISRQLLAQTVVNLIYGTLVGIGLYFLGVPYAFLWGALASLLRFVPYVGPFIGAAGPILVALAALPGWSRPLWVIGLFIALELFTNLVLETILYSGAAGVSPLALLVALAFWTWLWGPMGLLMGTPLTICIVVLASHVPGMKFLSTLLADEPALPADMHYYQRLLAHDPSEASDVIDRHLKAEAPETVYDALLVPALNYAKQDRLEQRLSSHEEQEVVDSTRELLGDVTASTKLAARNEPGETPARAKVQTVVPEPERTLVLAWPANSQSDELALTMLGQLLEQSPVELEILSEQRLSAEIVAAVEQRGCATVCIADLPPSAPSRTRYFIKKLRAALPALNIVVGRWAPPALADDQPELLLNAGANYVESTLIATRDRLCELARLAPGPAASSPASSKARMAS
jgi:predicted PurR-regulated permease PerM